MAEGTPSYLDEFDQFLVYVYCNRKCFHCLSPLEKDQCSHFPALDYLSRVQVINAAAKHVLVCNACHVSPTAAGRCLGFINEQSRCEKTCTGDELFCCAEHGENVKLVDQNLIDDVTEDTDDRDPSDRYRGSKREAVWQASNQECFYCGVSLSKNDWVADHLVPVASNGETTFANGVAACRSCNSSKAAKSHRLFIKECGGKNGVRTYVRCQGFTISGTRCKRPATKGQYYCSSHAK